MAQAAVAEGTAALISCDHDRTATTPARQRPESQPARHARARGLRLLDARRRRERSSTDAAAARGVRGARRAEQSRGRAHRRDPRRRARTAPGSSSTPADSRTPRSCCATRCRASPCRSPRCTSRRRWHASRSDTIRYVADVAVVHVIGEGVAGYATAVERLDRRDHGPGRGLIRGLRTRHPVESNVGPRVAHLSKPPATAP